MVAHLGPEPLALSVSQLDVWLGPVQICFGVDLALPEGSIGALVGTNGAGKSTVLRAIAGVLPARRGSIVLFGDDITRLSVPARVGRGLTLVPGGRATFATLTVEESLNVATWPFRRDRARVRAALGQAASLFPSLAGLRHQRTGTLSGGQQQLVSLARAVIARPRLLLVDEVTLGLAPAAADEALAALSGLGTTILLVEQSIGRALSIARWAWFLDRGEVRYAGPADKLAERADLLRPVLLAPP